MFLAVGGVIEPRRSEALEEKSPPRRGQAKTAIAAVREVQYIQPIGIKAIAVEVPDALDDCLGALRIQAEMSRQTLEHIAKRRKELD